MMRRNIHHGLGLGVRFALRATALRPGHANPTRTRLTKKSKSEAENYYKQGNYQKTIELTTQVIQQNKKDDVAHYLRGSAEVEEGLRRQQRANGPRRHRRRPRSHRPQRQRAHRLLPALSLRHVEPVAIGRPERACRGGDSSRGPGAQSAEHQRRSKSQRAVSAGPQRVRCWESPPKPRRISSRPSNSIRCTWGRFWERPTPTPPPAILPRPSSNSTRRSRRFRTTRWSITTGGCIYQKRKEYDKALADFTRVIELDKNAYLRLHQPGLHADGARRPASGGERFRPFARHPAQPADGV